MPTNQELRQASVRASTGTAYAYNDDWMALFVAAGITSGTFNDRLLVWINTKLSSSYTNINDAMRMYAINQGFTSWNEMGTFSPGGGAPADTTAPILSSPTGTQTGATTATIGVTTDEANGTLYSFVSTSATPPSGTDLKAGTGAVFANSQTITTTGAKTASATGLTASTAYYAHWLHRDAAGNDSTIASSASFTTAAGGTFVPTDYSGLDFWLDGSDSYVAGTWTDKSGNTRTATQGTGANQPAVAAAAQNGLSVVRFDSTDSLAIADYALAKLHIFAVVKNTAAAGNKHIMRKGAAAYPFIFRYVDQTLYGNVAQTGALNAVPTAVAAATGWHLCELSWDGTTVSLSADGGTATTAALAGTALRDTADVITIGHDGAGAGTLSSDIAEIVFYNRTLDPSTEAPNVRTYLTTKWGL